MYTVICNKIIHTVYIYLLSIMIAACVLITNSAYNKKNKKKEWNVKRHFFLINIQTKKRERKKFLYLFL